MSRGWFYVMNLWFLLWLFSMHGLHLVVSIWSGFGLLNLVYYSCGLLCMNDWRGMMHFSYWLMMHFNGLFSRLLLSNVYGRVVVFLNWLSVLSLLDLLGFFNVGWFFMTDVAFLFLG